ncbi:MAG: hypothetical protein V1860_03350 [bacterium]
MKIIFKNNNGEILIQAIVFGIIATIFIGGLVNWAIFNIKAARQTLNREFSIQIAEAGIDYYRWHLAHAPSDYYDGTGIPGHYTHDFKDKEGNIIGQFTLDITPPPAGSTLVKIKSTGHVVDDSDTSRSIAVQFVIPSFAKYAVIANSEMRFGEGTEVFGPIHSNGGIRFDGLAHNIISSVMESYNDPDHSGNKEFGVHTHVSPVDPLPPNPVPTRTDVFMAGRQFPVPSCDFDGLTSDLAQIKEDAEAAGMYFSDSGALGYHIVLRTDDMFELYRVNTLVPIPSGCTLASGQQKWGTWSILGETLMDTYSFPANGLIFIEDDLWINGQIDTARLTIAAGRFPDNPAHRKSITVNNDLLYTNYDGRDIIALIAQDNFNVGFISEDDLRIDAALISQNGRVGRYYYRPPSDSKDRCAPYHLRQTITLYGMLASNERYGFSYANGTGYQIRNIIYDTNLLFSPPPNFPLTSDQYTIISWEEVK